jgi:hypothetical protein
MDTGDSTVRLVAPTGVVSRPELLRGIGDTPSVAVGPRGEVLVAWTDDIGHVWARFRPPGGPFGSPERVAAGSSEGTEGMPVAIDARGVAVLAWGDAHGALRVRFRDPVTGWGAEQRLGGRNVTRPHLAVAAGGTAVLAWLQDGPSGPNSTQVAVSTRAGDSAFGRPQVVGGPAGDPSDPAVSTDERGDAAVVWVDIDAHLHFSVHAAFARGGARFGHAVTLSRDEATAPVVAVRPSGRAILAWRNNQAHRVQARVRLPSGRLGRARTLSRRLEVNGSPAALMAGHGAVGWSDDEHGVSVVRVAPANAADGGFGRARVVGRIRGFTDEPAFTIDAPELAVVARPPLDPRDPIRWARVAL